MATDKTNYNIVQVSESDWGIQYSDGSLVTGFSSRENAIEVAAETASSTPVIAYIPPQPRNLEEAMIAAQSSRDEYRKFISENPTASQEALEAQAAKVMQADAYVSEYSVQNEIARQNASNREIERNVQFEIQRQNADQARIQANVNAVTVRRNGGSQQEVQEAENNAFQAELYYQSLQREQQQRDRTAYEGEIGEPLSLFDGGSRDFVSQFGQVISSDAQVLATSSNSLDLTRTNLRNELGSIQQLSSQPASLTSGYGSVQYQGNIVYDTSVGVTVKTSTSEQRVRLSPKASQRGMLNTGVLQPLAETGGLVFPYTPTITMQGSTNYNTLETTHANQNWHIYQNTPSIDITISGVFTAQNETEAKYLLACIHFLRVLTKMRFGRSEANKGLPPPQVFLDGYGTHMFNGLSVIVKTYSTQLNDNVDYVNVNSGGGISKVPSMTTLEVMCTVQQTPEEAKKFNWDEFASGSNMKGWL